MTSKRVLRRRDSHLFTYILLAGFALLYLVPIFWLVISSFKEEAELFRFPPSLLPERFSVSSYVMLGGGRILLCILKIPLLSPSRQPCLRLSSI